MYIILIAGKSGSGKTLAAHMLKKKLEKEKKRALITEYSKYIKLYAKEMLEWDGDILNKPRDFLQEVGSFIRIDLHMPSFFIDRMKEDIKVYERFFDVIIISDVRYPDEITKMKDTYENVISVQIKNEEAEPVLTEKQSKHITEHALDHYEDFDYIIDVCQMSLENEIKKIVEEVV